MWSCFTILIVAAFGILVSSVTSTLSAVNISMHETGSSADAGWARTIVPPPQERRAHIGSVHSWLVIYDKTSSAARSVVVTGPVCFVVSMPVSGRTEARREGQDTFHYHGASTTINETASLKPTSSTSVQSRNSPAKCGQADR